MQSVHSPSIFCKDKHLKGECTERLLKNMLFAAVFREKKCSETGFLYQK